MAHPGLHSGSQLSYITLYHLCGFFRNPGFSNAFALWDWNMQTNHKCSTFLFNRFMFSLTGSSDEEDCLTMRSIWFSLSKLQWRTFYTRLIHTADLKVSFRGIYHIAAFASMTPHNHLCMYLCGTLDVRSFGVILFPPPEYDKKYSRHHSQILIIEELNFLHKKNWFFLYCNVCTK